MKLIVGLGNPGADYDGTRHNVGFMVIEKIRNSKFDTRNGDQNSSFRFNKPFQADLIEGLIDDQDVLLVKPVNFMNNSGLSVKKLITSYDVQPANDLIIIHDDITLDLGQVKLSKNAGAGNHNGVQSIINHLNTKDFIRVRCGIGRGDGILSEVVLSKFRPDEKKSVNIMIQTAAEATVMILKEGIEKAMNEYN